VPPSPAELEEAAVFASMAVDDGDIMVHCAHGRGRSTTVMLACLVRAGVHPNWQSAFEAVRRLRPVCKLNSKMRKALTTWQARYGTLPLTTKSVG
jgi:protein-tyrosine phosphatase